MIQAHHLSRTATTPFPARVTAHACMVPAWALSAADSGCAPSCAGLSPRQGYAAVAARGAQVAPRASPAVAGSKRRIAVSATILVVLGATLVVYVGVAQPPTDLATAAVREAAKQASTTGLNAKAREDVAIMEDDAAVVHDIARVKHAAYLQQQYVLKHPKLKDLSMKALDSAVSELIVQDAIASLTQDEAKKTSLEATKTSAGQELQQAGEDGGDNTAPIMFNDPFLDNAGDTSRVLDL